MTPRTANPERAAEVEGTILEAARDVLASGGLDALSMRVVADRVGLSATAIYHYFENKDELVKRVVDRGFRRFGNYLQEGAASHPRGSLERIHALSEAYLRFAFENEEYFRVLFSLHRSHPQTIEDLPEGGGYGLLRQAVVDAVEAGTIRQTNPDLMVLYLWSLVHGLVTIALSCQIDDCPEFEGVPRSPVELFQAFGELVRSGIRAPEQVIAPTVAAGTVGGS